MNLRYRTEWLTLPALGALMVAVLAVSAEAAITREYYVQAEDVVWDFAPSNRDLAHNTDIPAPWAKSHIFQKVRYIEYSDSSFGTKKPQPIWLGVLGPIIRAEVGDTVVVHFRNGTTSGSYGMHPHGLRYTKDNEGAWYFGSNTGQAPRARAEVPPGGSFDYVWEADADSGPGPGDPSSLVWWYHSHINEPAETNAGRLGPIIVTRKGQANLDGTPKDVNREFVTAFFIFDEANGAEKGLMHGINGYIFGNLLGLEMYRGERVRWYLLGMGNEVDLHTPHWHGKTVVVGDGPTAQRKDVVNLLPATMITATMRADNPGEWFFHCHVADHVAAGMLTSFVIR